MRPISLLTLLLSSTTLCLAQEENDSLQTLEEVRVRAFEQNRRAASSTVTVKFIETNNGDRYNKTSFLNGLNTVTGVRMEERSPGSYRINIRGSSIRSPFGVRNVKVYWNDIPLTDPGGNTYFNQLAWNNFSSMELVKGPTGSLYGAGTGGLILIQNFSTGWRPGISLEYLTGSYNLQNIFASARFGSKENQNQLTYAHNQHDGYREQSAMRRDNFSWISQLKLTDKQQLTASLLYTDMYYQTPGALTLAEFEANPKSARPAAGVFPSATGARAAIDQKNFLAGLSSIYQWSKNLKQSTTLYGAFNQVKNPAIRNYERRKEPGFGGRMIFSWQKKWEQDYSGQKTNDLQLSGGNETQLGYFNTQVFSNQDGNPDTLQTNDDINYTAYSFFLQGDLAIRESWFFHAGASLNKTRVDFTRLSSYPVLKQGRSYRNEIAPRFSLKKILSDVLSVKATVARGFSPPTVAELLPSTGVISTELEAEYGWNYELTGNYSLFRKNLNLELTGYYFRLNKALVQRRDAAGADFFVNAGDIQQKGVEIHGEYIYSGVSDTFLDYFILRADYTFSHFRYGNFIKGADDFSGKYIPSVPRHTFSFLSDFHFNLGLYLNLSWYNASKIFLNDANTAIAQSYQLLGARIGWRNLASKKYKFTIYAGADNLLDEHYSLGHDINAAGGRYFNAAPLRNYYIGISFQWIKALAKQ